VLVWWRIWASGFVFIAGLAYVLHIAPGQFTPRTGTPESYAFMGFFIGSSITTFMVTVIWK